MIKKLSLLAVVLLAGCSSPAQRMHECESQGISRDTCYLVEQNRQQSYNAQAQAQAYRNAAAAVAEPERKQHAQSVHRYHKTDCKDLLTFAAQGLEMTPPQRKELADCKSAPPVEEAHPAIVQAKTWHGFGVVVARGADGIVTVDGKPAALDETTEKAKVYSQGLNQVVIYNNGKANLIVDKVIKGWLK